MIVAFTAWRLWTDVAFIHSEIRKLWQTYGDFHARVGDAAGGDAIIYCFIQASRLTIVQYKANVTKFGWPAAGPIRNRDMLQGTEEDGQLADLLVAFPQPGVRGRSPGSGSWGCVMEAHLHGIRVEIPAYRTGD